MGIRLAIVGAGSTYCPELMEGLVRRRETLPVAEIRLMDVDAEKLGAVGGFCKRYLAAQGLSAAVTLTGSLEDAVRGADFIVTQIRVGRLDARIRDERIPMRYGMLGQETTGIGGFLNALRTIPAMAEIAAAAERLAPDAWLVNFTNPSGIVSEFLQNRTRVKSVGLCNLPIGRQELLCKATGLPMEGTRLESISLNHCGAVTGFYAGEQDLLPRLLAPGSLDHILTGNEAFARYRPLIERLHAIPNDYLQYFYFRDETLQKALHAEQTRGEICEQIEARLLSYYADAQNTAVPSLLAERGGHLYSEAAVALIESLYGAKNGCHVIDVQNRGVLDFLPDDAVIETCCRVEKDRIMRIPVQATPCPALVTLLQSVKAYERLTVEAALTGSRETAMQALLCNPITADIDKAAPCLAEMLAANREFLPRFFA